MGITALGLVDRGFDTTVQPDMSHPLEETDCISCGQCISVCPTGALQEKLLITKPCPLTTTKGKQICSHCSIGCNTIVETRGNMALRVLPDPESLVDNGLLCVKGRFGYNLHRNEMRLKTPLLRVQDELKEVSWDEAIFYAAKKLESIRFRYGSDRIAMSISDQWSLEDMYVAQKLGQSVLGTPWITNFNTNKSSLDSVFGFDASPNTLDEVSNTNCILLIGSYTYRDHTIAALKIKNAVEKGATLITINPCDTKMDEWATMKVNPTNSITFLKEIAAAMVSIGCQPKNVQGWDDVLPELKSLEPSKEAVEIAHIYTKAKKAMIVFDQNQLSREGIQWTAYLALISGHIGKPRDGIIQLKPQNNSQSLPIVGIDENYQAILQKLQDDMIHALLILGENPMKTTVMSKPKRLIVMDTHLTETALRADVVLPSCAPMENCGTYISMDLKIQSFASVLPMEIPYPNWKIFQQLSTVLKELMKFN
jgi:formate dehydrogenase major subunit